MLKDYLDCETYALIKKYFNFADITEIRMRLGQNLIICVKNKKYYLKNEKQQLVVVDYTRENGRLKSSSVNAIVEDRLHHVWAATTMGRARIDTQGRATILMPRINFLGCYVHGDRVFAFCKGNQTGYVFNLNGQLLSRVHLSQAMGHIGAIKGCVGWQGRWLVCAGEASFILAPSHQKGSKDYVWSKPADLQIRSHRI